MKNMIINEFGEHLVIMDRSDRGPLTEEERSMIANMDKIVDDYDDECPEMPRDMIIQMRRDIANRKVSTRAVN